MLPFDEADIVMISALQHYQYCPRQFALIYIEKVFDDNEYTLRGQAVHQRVDASTTDMAPNGNRIVRALPVFNDALGLRGRADVVEFTPEGQPIPVEYKLGSRKRQLHDDIQLCAQAVCLEAMFNCTVTQGAIYHVTSRRRRVVAFEAPLRQELLRSIEAVRALQCAGTLPPPLQDDSRCTHCSLIERCQPEMLSNATTKQKDTMQQLFQAQD